MKEKRIVTQAALEPSVGSLSSGEAVGALLDRPLLATVRINWETVTWIGLLIVAFALRIYDVGVRAMSHDESLHALYSYYLYNEGRYEHNPMMHGPFLFHINALVYFLFGDSDTTARLAPVIAGLGVVYMAWLFRRYLGRTGALCAGVMLTISPSLLFHSRYIRDDIYIALFLMIWIYGAFRYLDTHNKKWLMAVALGMVFGILSMEAHFISGALLGAFFTGVALWQTWRQADNRRGFWTALRHNPSADLAILMLTLVLPFTAPFVHLAIGGDVKIFGAMDNLANKDLMRFGALEAVVVLFSVAIAYYWYGMRRLQDEAQQTTLMNLGDWGRLMTIFWVIAILFYTTFLTNTKDGLATGIVGSLGYWLAQQGVARGGQPTYYYLLIGWMYEFLPIILSFAGMVVVARNLLQKPDWDPVPAVELAQAEAELEAAQNAGDPERLRQNRTYFAVFSIWWVIGAWVAFTLAGEKMPWLLTHIALPMCVFGGWYLGRLLHQIDWGQALRNQAVWLIGIAPALIVILAVLFGAGPDTDKSLGSVAGVLQAILGIALVGGLVYLAWHWGSKTGWPTAARLLSLGIVSLLFLLTVRFSYMLNYINYDMATEYLVYAHATPDIKRALNEIDLISERTVGGRNIVVAYDDDSSWPLSWYMRLYPNAKFYGANPNTDVMAAPVIIVGEKNYEKVHPYVARDYVKRTYRLVWWPDMDYFNMTWSRLFGAVTDPQQRDRIWNIFFYRRYKDKNDQGVWNVRDLSLWPHRHPFEMWVRRDLAAQIWNLGVTPVAESTNSVAAVARQKEINVSAFGLYNTAYNNAPLVTPRVLAVGADGSRVIADSGNNRIVVLDRDGKFVRAFGSACNITKQDKPGCQGPDGDGQFNEPWGIAVDPKGNIYVADTWNGRIQVFDSTGKFLRKWGAFSTTNGELGDEKALFGPRGIAVNLAGNVVVADTGNKRIIEYTPNGDLVRQIGGGGVTGSHFDEPVGVAVSPTDGSIFVTDAWNRRIQKFTPDLKFVAEWPVPSWDNHDIYTKPYLAVASNGDVYVTDPQYYRVFVYNANGELKAAFGNFGTDANRFGLPNGIAIDLAANAVLVADANNNRVMAFAAIP
ncbi:MAG: TIGR03663 family protein [Caldilineaceae bacterium]